jgi:hypothetical protein
VLTVASGGCDRSSVAAEEDAAIGAIRHPGRLAAKARGGLVRHTGTRPRMGAAAENAGFSEKAPRRQPGMF